MENWKYLAIAAICELPALIRGRISWRHSPEGNLEDDEVETIRGYGVPALKIIDGVLTLTVNTEPINVDSTIRPDDEYEDSLYEEVKIVLCEDDSCRAVVVFGPELHAALDVLQASDATYSDKIKCQIQLSVLKVLAPENAMGIDLLVHELRPSAPELADAVERFYEDDGDPTKTPAV